MRHRRIVRLPFRIQNSICICNQNVIIDSRERREEKKQNLNESRKTQRQPAAFV